MNNSKIVAKNLKLNSGGVRVVLLCVFAVAGALIFLLLATRGRMMTQKTAESVDLAPAGDGGSLRIETEPPGASVLLNGRLAGTTPCELTGLDSGSYGLRLEKEGCNSVKRKLELGGDGLAIKEKLL